MSAPPRNFFDLSRAELTALLGSWDVSPVHAARLWSAVYNAGAPGMAALAALPELPRRLRTRLETEFALALPPVAAERHSTDGFTRKYLLALGDGRRIETVLMRFTGRVTACVSSQAGCAMGCGFCATGRMGFQRQLTPGEIVAQVMHIRRVVDEPAAAAAGSVRHAAAGDSSRLRNVVLMGMGEPLHNYDAVMQGSRSCAIRTARRSARAGSR